MPMPHYQVRLKISKDHCWHTRVEVQPFQQLTHAEIEQRAVAQAVRAFGRQARGWTLIDAHRKRG